MRVVEGRHSGLLCEVQALEPREEGRSGERRAAAPGAGLRAALPRVGCGIKKRQ